MLDETTKSEIVERLKTLIRAVAPTAVFGSKYGGTIVQTRQDQTKSHFCGVYAYTNHVSLEFTHGARLNDPDGILHGNGKYRRHVKITRLSDIQSRQCAIFLEQAYRAQIDTL